MKRATILIATVVLCCGIIHAQQPTKQAHADAIKMSAEDSTRLTEILQASAKYAEANAKLISAWKDYSAQQSALQAEFDRRVARAAIAAHLTIEQLDNSDLKVDEKGNYEWVPKPRPPATTKESAKPVSP